MRCWTRIVALGVLVACGLRGQAQEPLVRINVEDEVVDWILDEPTARIFGALADKAAVAEFDPATGQRLRQFDVGQKPARFAIKGRRLVVACQAGPSLSIINLDDNQVEGTVELIGKSIGPLFCSKASNNFAYAIVGKGEAWWDGEVFQVDVVKRHVVKRVPVQGWEQSHAVNVAMSSDGGFIIVDAGERSTGPAALMSVDEDALVFRNVYRHLEADGQVVAAPFGRFWTVGADLYPVDFGPETAARLGLIDRTYGELKPLRQFAGSVVAVHPTDDLAASITTENRSVAVVLQTFSKAIELKTAPLCSTSDYYPPREKRQLIDNPNLQFAKTEPYLLIGYGRFAAVLDWKKLGVTTHPLLVLSVPTQVTVVAGEPLQLPLEVTSPGLSPGFTKVDGPEAARIDKGALVWTPSENDVGTHRAKLRAEVDGRSDEAEVLIRVVRPGLNLGFLAQMLVSDTAGKRVVVAGYASGGDDDRGHRPVDQLALIDVEQQAIVAQKQFEKGIAAIAIDSQAVYMAPTEGNVVHALSLDDLSYQQRAFVEARVTSMALLPPNRLVVATARKLFCFATDKLKKVSWPFDAVDTEYRVSDFYMNNFHYQQVKSPAERLNDGTLVENIVFDRESGDIQLIVPRDSQMIDVTAPVDEDDWRPRPMQAHRRAGPWQPHLWNRRVANDGLYGRGEGPLARWNHGAAVLLHRHPLAASVAVRYAKGGGSPDGLDMMRDEPQGPLQLVLELRELLEGATRHTLVLAEHQRFTDRFRRQEDFNRQPLVADCGDTVVVGHTDKLYVVDFDVEKLGELREPLRFTNRQSTLSAKAGEEAKLTFTATGGAGTIRYKLTGVSPGLTLDAETGELTVDTTVFSARLEALIRQRLMWHEGTEELKQYLAAGLAEYEQVFGAKTEDIPLRIQFGLQAVDQQGLTADLASQLIVMTPREKYTELVGKVQGEIDQRRAEAIAERQRQQDEADRARDAQRAQNAAPAGDNSQLIMQLTETIQANNEISGRLDRIDRQVASLDEGIVEMRAAVGKISQQLSDQSDANAADNEIGEQVAELDALQEDLRSLGETASSQSSSLKLVLTAQLVMFAIFAALFVVVLRIVGRPSPPADSS